MKPTTTWILIADGARARIVVNKGPGKGVVQLEGADFRTEHPPSGDMMTDRPGRSFASVGDTRHAMEQASDPHRAAKQAFAEEVADYLHRQVMKKRFDRLIVLAPPQALGDLRAALSEPVRALVTAELAKDLTPVPNEDLPKHLGDVLAV